MDTSSRFIILDTVDSTNNHASKLIAEGVLEEGTVVFTHHQQNGRGQRGNSWQSNKEENILMSLVLFPYFLAVKQIFKLNECIALGVRDYVAEKIPADVSVKWPNDILVGEKKIAGILIENSLRSTGLQSCIAGVGLNVNQTDFPEGLGRAVSLKLILKSDFDLIEETKLLQEKILKRYDDLKNKNFENIHQSYNAHLFGRGQKRKFKINDLIFDAAISGVTEEGKLHLEKEDGEKLFLNNKEVEYMW